MGLVNTIQATALKKIYDYVDKNPRENFPKIIDMADKFLPHGHFDPALNMVKKTVSDPDNNWYKFAMSLWDDIDDGVRAATFQNLIINATLKWADKAEELRPKYNCNIPWAILLDPTSACNLHCTGCWAAEYGNRLNLSFEEMDNLIRQANELGTRFFLFTGGEPLVRKKDVISLCEAHQDCQFMSFTNATLIDDEFAEEMLRVKNFIPAISVEGFEEDTDFRRGNGTFNRVERAMAILKKHRLPFGISCCYTSKNVQTIGSEAYFDQMIEWGAKFCWFFTYMPIGNDAVPELMVSAEQRKFMYEQVRKFRKTKPIFTLDFWNDGEYVHGCIAGGRRYIHVNANGDYEPCAFIHYSDSNLREKTLLEALQGPLFQAYKKGQPFNCNHLRPCPLLDNPDRLVDMVHSSGAHSTDLESPVEVDKESSKCIEKAEKWGPVADKMWIEAGHSLDTQTEAKERALVGQGG